MRILFILCLSFGISHSLYAEKLLIIASVKPIAMLAREIAGEKAETVTLLPNGGSPHHYALRVSDVRNLSNADLILWVGPQLERFLDKTLSNLGDKKHLTLSSIPALEWPDSFSGTYHAGHTHHKTDQHIWMNPRNGAVIAEVIADKLSQLRPLESDYFYGNANRLRQALESYDKALKKQFNTYKKHGFVVFHDGYRHFVDAYGLYQIATVTTNPEQKPGARHLYNLRKQLSGQATCLLLEPYHENSTAVSLARELNLPVVSIDPLGKNEYSYKGLMSGIANSFQQCIEPEK